MTGVPSADGSTLLKEKEEILARWAVHFKEVLNRDMPIDSSSLDGLPTPPGRPELDSVPISDEDKNSIKSIRNKKLPVMTTF